jgi:hypothetical protein
MEIKTTSNANLRSGGRSRAPKPPSQTRSFLLGSSGKICYTYGVRTSAARATVSTVLGLVAYSREALGQSGRATPVYIRVRIPVPPRHRLINVQTVFKRWLFLICLYRAYS